MKLNILKSKKIFLILIFLLGAIRIWLMMGMPVFITGNSPHDDMALMNHANSVLNGNWFGEYSRYTLMKMPIYSLFLACCSFLNIPYLLGLGILYTFACITFIFSIKYLIKNETLLMLIYILLLISPVMLSYNAQKLYRMAIIPASVILVISCFSAIYIRRNCNIKILIPWAIGAGFSLSFFWFTREDSIWILPFVVAAVCITIISLFFKYKKEKKEIFIRSILVTTPIIILFGFNILFCTINYLSYGIFATNDLVSTNCAKVMNNIYKIEPEEEKPYVWINKSTVEELYKVSPTFSLLKNSMDIIYQGFWQSWGMYPNDGEIEGNYFLWALRDATASIGYYTDAKKTDEFYKKINSEIETAFKNGLLTKRKSFVFSSIARSWKAENAKLLYDTSLESLDWIFNYKKMNTDLFKSTADNAIYLKNLRLSEIITKESLIYPDENYIDLSGWVFAKNNNDKLEASVRNNTGNKYYLILKDSPDVYNFYTIRGFQYKNAHKSRFSIQTNELKGKDIFLDIYINDVLNTSINLNTQKSGDTQSIKFNLDNIIITNESDQSEAFFKRNVDLSKTIINAYKVSGIIVIWVSIIAYLMITFFVIIGINKKQNNLQAIWLILTGILISFIILILGVSYNYMEAWNKSGRWYYMAGSYPLMNMFSGLSICYIIIHIKRCINERFLLNKKK